MNGQDFIYNIEKRRINELATRGSSKTTSGSSYNRLAYNVFRSIYPPEMNIFKAEGMGTYDTAKQYVDYLQTQKGKGQKLTADEIQSEIMRVQMQLKDPNFNPEEKEKIQSAAEGLAAHKKASQLAYRIWSRVKDYIASHESEGITDAMVQSWILDPGNEVGQEILSGIRGPGGVAQVVGINGEPVTGWSKELWSGELDDTDSIENPDSIKKPEKKLDRQKSSEEEVRNQQKTVEKYRGRSKIPEENRKFFTAFIKKVLMQAHKSGVLKTISIVNRGQGGRASGKDRSAYEFALTQAVRPVISAVAFNFADIAVRALIEFELLSADTDFQPDWSPYQIESQQIDNPDMDLDDDSDLGPDMDFDNKPKEDEPDIRSIKHPVYKNVKPVSQEDLSSYAKQIFEKIKDQMELAGIKLLPVTIKNLGKRWIKMASSNLESAGFDDKLGKELEYYANRLNKTPEGETFKLSAPVRKAIRDTTQDIANDLYNNTEFMKTFADFVIDSEEIKRLLREIDPTISEKEAEIKRRQQPPQRKSSRFTRIPAPQPRNPMLQSPQSPSSTPLPESPPISGVGESLQSFKDFLLNK